MILLDANAIIGLMKAENRLLRLRYREALASGEAVAVSSVVLFELRYGIAKSGRPQQNREKLQTFMSGPLVRVDFDDEDATCAGDLRAMLVAAGTPIGPYDLLIVAQALRRGATLVTANTREFSRVAGLGLVNWAE